MLRFTIHSLQSAPETAKPILEQFQQRAGFVPNLAATMANTPNLLEAYAGISASFGRGSFNPAEREQIALTVGVENACNYCVAAHSTFALAQGAVQADVEAIRAGRLPGDLRLAALVQFTRQLHRKNGQLSDEELQDFLKAGFTEGQILEVLIGISLGNLANLIYRLAGTPLDEGFQPQKWLKTA